MPHFASLLPLWFCNWLILVLVVPLETRRCEPRRFLLFAGGAFCFAFQIGFRRCAMESFVSLVKVAREIASLGFVLM